MITLQNMWDALEQLKNATNDLKHLLGPDLARSLYGKFWSLQFEIPEDPIALLVKEGSEKNSDVG